MGGLTPLLAAASAGRAAVVAALLAGGADAGAAAEGRGVGSGQRALALAAGAGHVGVVRLLLRCSRMDVDAVDTRVSWMEWPGSVLVAAVRCVLQ